uniref:Variant surface glycoprotein 1125.1338 n=1 Tax=Trypanosoma brucei TaxID=5691 RepID=A0A1J0R6T0_9TRYP|nr:variant surface glycoprotein 1125.1338 [Trypanosoma brucei]
MHMFVTCFMLVAVSIQATRGEKPRECSTSCWCAARIRRRLAAVKAELDADVSANDKNKADRMKLLVAAITADDDTKRKVAPVLAAAGKITSQCDEELQAASVAYANALKLTEQLAAIYSVQHLISTGTGKIHITLDSSNPRMAGGTYAGVFSLGILGTMTCKNYTSEDSETSSSNEEGSDAESNPTKLITHVNIAGNCQRDETASNSCDSGNDIKAGAQIQLAMAFDTGRKSTTPTWSNMQDEAARLSKNEMDLVGNAGEHAHYEIKTLDAQIKNHNFRKDIRTYSPVASEAVYKLLLTKTTEGKEEAESGDELTGAGIKAVTSYRYADDGKNVKANLWDAVENSPEYLGKQKTEETTQVKKLETLDKVGEASARALAKHLKKNRQHRENSKGRPKHRMQWEKRR